MHKLNRPTQLNELLEEKNSYKGTPSAQKAWEIFGENGDRTKVREQLEEIQNYLCAYCENSLVNDGHIDHFKPKSSNWKLTFDWENLLVSCTHNDSCGRKKDDNFEDYWINPYLTDPTEMFRFYSDGQIKGNTEDAENIIKDFGLDSPRLESKRKGILSILVLTINALKDYPDALEAYLESEQIVIFPTAYTQIRDKTLAIL